MAIAFIKLFVSAVLALMVTMIKQSLSQKAHSHSQPAKNESDGHVVTAYLSYVHGDDGNYTEVWKYTYQGREYTRRYQVSNDTSNQIGTTCEMYFRRFPIFAQKAEQRDQRSKVPLFLFSWIFFAVLLWVVM